MLPCHQAELQRFFQEVRRPIWEGRVGRGQDAESSLVKYGKFDYSQFSELELRCYILIKARMASKLYALYEMELDVEKGRADELERRT